MWLSAVIFSQRRPAIGSNPSNFSILIGFFFKRTRAISRLEFSILFSLYWVSLRAEAKASLQKDIDRFTDERILMADKVTVKHTVAKIRDADVLLTYGSSSAVEMILLYARDIRRQFRIVIVDSRPKFESQLLLRKLLAKGLSCIYMHVTAIPYITHEVTRVFLGFGCRQARNW